MKRRRRRLRPRPLLSFLAYGRGLSSAYSAGLGKGFSLSLSDFSFSSYTFASGISFTMGSATLWADYQRKNQGNMGDWVQLFWDTRTEELMEGF